VQQLDKTALAVLKRPERRTKFTALGTDLVAMPSAQFAERMRAESKQYGEIIKRIEFKAT
jgi:tripartite-type tricarboxylate transporter receptor subunit TctC